MVNAHRLKLLSYLSSFKRYKHIRALAFDNEVSLDSQKQFATITYQGQTQGIPGGFPWDR